MIEPGSPVDRYHHGGFSRIREEMATRSSRSGWWIAALALSALRLQAQTDAITGLQGEARAGRDAGGPGQVGVPIGGE